MEGNTVGGGVGIHVGSAVGRIDGNTVGNGVGVSEGRGDGIIEGS